MMDSRHQHCGCCTSPASHLCCCVWPPLPLCQVCAQAHPFLLPGLHSLLSMPIDLDQVDPFRWKATQARLTHCQVAQACTELTIQAIDEYISIVEGKASEAARNLTRYRVSELEALRQEIRTKTGEARKEVRRHLLDQTLSHFSQFARWMVQCRHEPVCLFHWKLADEEDTQTDQLTYFLDLPEKLVQAEDNLECYCTQDEEFAPLSQVPTPEIALIRFNILYSFHTANATWTRTVLDSHGSGSEGCMLFIEWSDGQYWGIEGSSYYAAISHCCVYGRSGYVRRNIGFQTARFYPGTLLTGHQVYLFGGGVTSGEVTATAEVVDLTGQLSTRIPDMLTARRSFTPCEHLVDIYLCGGMSTSLCEKYDPRRQIYTPLSVVLSEGTDTLACWQGEVLLIITRHSLTVWSPDTTPVSHSHDEWVGLSGSSPFLSLHNKLFNAALGQVNVIDLPTFTLRRYAPPS